jgi:8-oxo-dGTP pyrophosphatase MutT (NUDIX family)
MVAASILPVSIYKNKLYFLFGKENSMEDSAKGWSDFGGRCDKGETLYQTAIREGSEELTGFLGNNKELSNLIKQNGGTLKMKHNEYHIHIFFLPYDDNLPKYYNYNHKFLWEKMDKKLLNKTKLFEKIEIKWFSVDDLVKQRKVFRNFYQEITDLFIENKQNIADFIKLKHSKHNK